MKNCKTFCKAQIASRLKEIIQPPPHPTPHQIKPYYVSRTKILLRRYIEIQRHLFSKCFKNAVLGRQEMVQCKYFFWHQTKMLARKFVKSETFLAMLREHIIFSVNWVEFRKKALRYSARKSEIKKKLMMSTGTSDQI